MMKRFFLTVSVLSILLSSSLFASVNYEEELKEFKNMIGLGTTPQNAGYMFLDEHLRTILKQEEDKVSTPQEKLSVLKAAVKKMEEEHAAQLELDHLLAFLKPGPAGYVNTVAPYLWVTNSQVSILKEEIAKVHTPQEKLSVLNDLLKKMKEEHDAQTELDKFFDHNPQGSLYAKYMSVSRDDISSFKEKIDREGKTAQEKLHILETLLEDWQRKRR